MVKKQAHSAAKHQRKLQRREEAENKRILARIPTDPTIFMDEDQLTKPITRTIRHQRRMSRHVLARPVFREMLTKGGGGGARASISGPSTAALRLPPPAIKLPESRRRRRSSLINQVYLKLLPNSPSLFKPDFRHSTYSGKSRSQLAKDVTKKREQVPNLQKIREQASRKAMDDAVARMRHSAEHLPQQQQYVPASSYTHSSVTSFDQYEAGMPLGLQRPRRSSDLGTMALGHDFGTAHLRMPTGQNTGIDENRQSQSSSRPCTPLNDVTHPSKIYSPLVKP
ncbi:hypothetical protein GQ42DRAFT_164396 [Ramicandelaber brevisporus]|nr:hypothetical protein GQ42DRAFT_164396 [Ramicandelaber brevisporus]